MAVLRHPLGEVKSPYQDLLDGLSETPKRIPAKYFYDEVGSRLFARITGLEEYYLTRSEREIMIAQGARILSACGASTSYTRLNVIELGAGDGQKTVPLLRQALRVFEAVTYSPIDISQEALKEVSKRMSREIPKLAIRPAQLDLDVDLEHMPVRPGQLNLVLYLGSSIGNYLPAEQRGLLRRIHSVLSKGDMACIGFDLRKDPRLLLKAYDDHMGVTREFNLNLLRRLNRELGARIEASKFNHLPVYNPATGGMESWLISLEEQSLQFPRLHASVHVEAFEGIHVETSWKFSSSEIARLARNSGFTPVASFASPEKWFTDELWKA